LLKLIAEVSFDCLRDLLEGRHTSATPQDDFARIEPHGESQQALPKVSALLVCGLQRPLVTGLEQGIEIGHTLASEPMSPR
jgi:hypothetical protein